MYEFTILLIGFTLGFLTKCLKDGQKTEHVITINNSTPRNIADAVYFGVLHSFQEFTIKYDDDVDLNDTCLLYTSPSPRDGLLSRMPSSA